MKDNAQLNVMASMPFQRRWPGLPDEVKHDASVELIGLALDSIAAERREPYHVESVNLGSAITAARARLSMAAFGFVHRALEPSNTQRRRFVGSGGDRVATMQELRERLAALGTASESASLSISVRSAEAASASMQTAASNG